MCIDPCLIGVAGLSPKIQILWHVTNGFVHVHMFGDHSSARALIKNHFYDIVRPAKNDPQIQHNRLLLFFYVVKLFQKARKLLKVRVDADVCLIE